MPGPGPGANKERQRDGPAEDDEIGRPMEQELADSGAPLTPPAL